MAIVRDSTTVDFCLTKLGKPFSRSRAGAQRSDLGDQLFFLVSKELIMDHR